MMIMIIAIIFMVIVIVEIINTSISSASCCFIPCHSTITIIEMEQNLFNLKKKKILILKLFIIKFLLILKL